MSLFPKYTIRFVNARRTQVTIWVKAEFSIGIENQSSNISMKVTRLRK